MITSFEEDSRVREWSVYQCPKCQQVFTGYTAFDNHTAAKACRPPKPTTRKEIK